MLKKIVINTNTNSAGTKVCIDDMVPRLEEAGYEVRKNDWLNYNDYDLAMFMGSDSEILKAKQDNPNIKTILMDPKLHKNKYPEIKKADLLLVSSIEQREALYFLNKNIFIYYMFPETVEREKNHIQDKANIKISYHGNKQHLNSFYPQISRALDNIGLKYNVELYAIYNINKLGKWKRGEPGNIKVHHIQWSDENLVKYISESDIGICPSINFEDSRLSKIFCRKFFVSFENIIISKSILKIWNIPRRLNILGYNKHDYILRFKNSTNPGRIYVFAQLGIPVISDFNPSSCEFIKDGVSGKIFGSSDGLEVALDELIKNAHLRNLYSKNLKKYIKDNFSPEINFEKFNKILDKM